MKFSDILQFIQQYRDFEKATVQEVFTVFKSIFPDKETVAHLCETWKDRLGDFGSFYLNLSWVTQFTLLAHMGLRDAEAEAFLEKCDRDPAVGLLKEPPLFLQLPNELLGFFLGHSIRKNVSRFITLPTLPTVDKRSGSARNWADYILALPEEQQLPLLKQIWEYLTQRTASAQ